MPDFLFWRSLQIIEMPGRSQANAVVSRIRTREVIHPVMADHPWICSLQDERVLISNHVHFLCTIAGEQQRFTTLKYHDWHHC